MNNGNSISVPGKFAHIVQTLQIIQAVYARGTNNQMGMPGHLRSVASSLDQVHDELTQLQDAIRSEAQQWNDAFQGGRRRKRATRRKRSNL